MAVDFSGKWKLSKTDGLDEFLKSQGVGAIKRKLAAKMFITQEIVQTKQQINN